MVHVYGLLGFKLQALLCLCLLMPFRYIRHPGYLGWLVWSVGTQVLLINPICTVLFGIVVSLMAIAFFTGALELINYLVASLQLKECLS